MSEELKGFFLMIIAACVLWIAIILAVTLVPIKEDISAARKCAEIMLQESRGVIHQADVSGKGRIWNADLKKLL